ncbi:MAG: sigma-54-dependent Fis family transcriptional regulator [Gemmatimonadetes bacterium]|nr:sigma-54-dependent Fis family transcriptional regulator [Gemmatimonadota bacterium]
MTPRAEHVISVLVADDDQDQRLLVEAILRETEAQRHSVTLAADGIEALRALREQVFDVAILDLAMPALDGLEVFEAVGGDPHRPQVIFLSGQGTVATATRAMKMGAYDFLEKPVDADRLVTLVWKAAQAREVIARSERLGAAARREASEVSIITEDPGMRESLRLLARVADSGVSVLVRGESGTGKELIARELHRLSGRANEPLVALNCAAVSEALAESELFGHEKGAFTGAATKKVGLVELADGGTLFLDEIGDLAKTLQAKFLRVLESKRFRRVGGLKEFPTNFRLVSATNQPLKELVAEDAFREDLLYRINAIEIELPPLRDRKGDIPILVSHFVKEFRPTEADLWHVEPSAMEQLVNYPWPGNVRELRNVIERVALLARDQTVRAADLGASLGTSGVAATVSDTVGADGAPGTPGLPSLNLDDLERQAIEQALQQTGWHQGRAAELLGISPRTLHRKIRAYDLERPRD